MATNIYLCTYKSQEQRGAPQPNIVELGFASDADAAVFGSNGDFVLSATNVSVDNKVSVNYALPYPAGTDTMCRCACTDGLGGWMQLRIYDITLPFDPIAFGTALIGAGLHIFPFDSAATSVNVAPFTPGPSV